MSLHEALEQQPDHQAGRPRDEQRELAILDAACDLLLEVGYDQLTLEAVAARAHSSKATIYRRWSNKAEVITEAIRRRAPEEHFIPDTGSLREDLLSLLEGFRTICEQSDGALIAAVMRAMQTSPELAEIVRSNVVEKKDALPQSVVDRAIARGELKAGTTHDDASEVMRAVVFTRVLVTGEPIDAGFVLHLVDDVVLPILRGAEHE